MLIILNIYCTCLSCKIYLSSVSSGSIVVLVCLTAAVILVPTRELALQTSQVCKELGKHLKIQVMVTTGGTSLKDDIMRLHQPVHLLVGTPGRILDLAKKGICVLKDCSMLIMDEVIVTWSEFWLWFPLVFCILKPLQVPCYLKPFMNAHLSNHFVIELVFILDPGLRWPLFTFDENFVLNRGSF